MLAAVGADNTLSPPQLPAAERHRSHYRDLALEMATDENAEPRERLFVAERQRDFYQAFCTEDLARVGSMSRALERERRERSRLLDELRQLRVDDRRQVTA